MRKLKKAISLSLALALSLAMAVPAFAAGTTEKIVLEEITVTLDNVLRKENHTLKLNGSNKEVTVYIVGDEGTNRKAVINPGYDSDELNFYDSSYMFDEEENGFSSGMGSRVEFDGPAAIEEAYPYENWNDNAELKEFCDVYYVYESGYETFASYVAKQSASSKPADTIPASGTAKASTQNVEVDGQKVEFQMYALLDANGNGTNYVKLRDMAHVLNGTKAQFSVGYSNETGITLTSGQSYQDNGSEMKTPFSGDRAYTGGGQTIQINGKAVELTAINLLDDQGGGYNYFKLRDLGAALGFNVGWSTGRGVYVETDKAYIG